ncbi:uncharacterized protein LOC113318383 [Papaver somniferum]|uniref:uncharacterized protein LOC113318383 n=1 Tax=Papaver somniferum TaxID=3469 RepID=UPI000E6FD5B3|nr:uncharacterized protein LOC113318383 [Papaver somniferum]
MKNEVTEKHLLDLTNQVSSLAESSSRFIRVLESTSSSVNRGSSYRTQTGGVEILILPYFDGTDPEGWIYKAELYFEFYEIPPLQQVKTASFHLDGKALQWYKWMKSVEPIQSWVGFSTALLKRFGKNHYDEPAAPLPKLSQGGSLDDYKEEFMEPTEIVKEFGSEEFVADPSNSEVVTDFSRDSSISSGENQDKTLDTELIPRLFFDEDDLIILNQQEGKPITELNNSNGIKGSQIEFAASKMARCCNKEIQFAIDVENYSI